MDLIEDDLSIRNKRTTHQDAKSNNAAQDNEQHNATPKRWNHERTQKKTWYMWKSL